MESNKTETLDSNLVSRTFPDLRGESIGTEAD